MNTLTEKGATRGRWAINRLEGGYEGEGGY